MISVEKAIGDLGKQGQTLIAQQIPRLTPRKGGKQIARHQPERSFASQVSKRKVTLSPCP
jgi:hypothetical protein